jgi:hypothetical protein
MIPAIFQLTGQLVRRQSEIVASRGMRSFIGHKLLGGMMDMRRSAQEHGLRFNCYPYVVRQPQCEYSRESPGCIFRRV